MKNSSILFLTLSLLAFGALQIPYAHRALAADTLSKDGEGGKKKGPEDITGGRFAGDPIYVHVSPMVLPVINENGVEQLVTIILDVQVKDFDAADQMHTNMPRIQDALMRALYGGMDQGTLRNGKLVDITKVKNKALAAVGEVIGGGNVSDVLVQSVSQRML